MGKITFILPPDRNIPIGGYKIVYEYANRLSSLGWDVGIGYDCQLIGSHLPTGKLMQGLIGKIVSKLRCKCYPTWFSLSRNVKKFCIFKELDIPPTENIVATSISTVSLVNRYSVGRKLYLIQGYEIWDGWSEKEVNESFCLGLKNIVITKWLKKAVDEACGYENSFLIQNGIDMQDFYIYNHIEKRKQKKISMLYHKWEKKGSRYGIDVLKKLKEIYPDLQAVIFGVPQRPANLPSWIEYVQKATTSELRKIYNESQIFLCPTIEEGFGLTCVESMACGCALCSTDYLGVHEFAVNEENALLSPVKDVDAMVRNACRLIDDNKLRIRLAENGQQSVKRFDWEKSVKYFERLLKC